MLTVLRPNVDVGTWVTKKEAGLMLGELSLAHYGLFRSLYELIYAQDNELHKIYMYWQSKRKKQQVHNIKMSNDDYECFKKVIFD